MKKRAKAKTSKTEMPELVAIMLKIAERLETLEKKTDLVFGRVANLPSEMSRAVQNFQRPDHGPQQNHGQPNERRERILYQAVCADCCKRCEVPFKPSGDRPVYCPECFAIRKAGHVPKDITSGIVVPAHVRELKTPSPAATKNKKTASKAAKKPTKKKKK